MASTNERVSSSEAWKEKLRKNYKSLVTETDLETIMDQIYAEEVFTDEEKELVEKVVPNTKNNKNRMFMDIMLKKTEAKFQIFLDCLEEIGHNTIVEQIKSTDISKDQNSPVISSEDWKEQLLRNYKNVLCLDLTVTLDELISKDVFTAEEKELVEKVIPNTTFEKNRQILKLLLEKTEANFKTFLNCLKDMDHSEVVKQIENTNMIDIPEYTRKTPEMVTLRRQIFRNYDRIVSETSLRFLLDDFLTNRVFEINDWERITNAEPNTKGGKNTQFLDILLTKESSGFRLLIEILKQRGHHELVTAISNTEVDDEVDRAIEYHARNKMKYVSVQQADPVPVNIREQYECIVKKWREEDLVFFETKGLKLVKDAAYRHTSVTLTGNGGAGKTASIHHIALELEREGYNILPVSDPIEIHKYLQKTQKQVFILDDPVGVHGLDKDKLKLWTDYDSKLEPCLLGKNTKILCSIRKQVCNDSDFQRSKCLLNKVIFNIQDEQHRMTNEEKKGVIEMHFKLNKIDQEITREAEIIFENTHEVFPLLCKMFASSKEFQSIGWNFFKHPFRLVLDDLTDMQDREKIKYCVLVLCLAFDNSLNPKMFNPFKSQKLRQKAEPYMIACGINEANLLPVFLKTADSLIGVYLQKQGGLYKFSHDLIYDVVAFHFGKTYPEEVIKHGSSKFIFERVAVSETTVVQCNDPYMIILDPDNFEDLAIRLLDLIEEGEYKNVFMHKCWEYNDFMRVFCSVFNERKYMVLNSFCFSNEPKYRDEVKMELQHLEESSFMNTWSWYFLAMYCLNTKGITPLHWVVVFGHKALFDIVWYNLSLSQIKQIIAKLPLIHMACLGGNVEMCKVLLEFEDEVEVNAPFIKDSNRIISKSPLMFAACISADVVQLLIEYGADVNSRTSEGCATSLSFAAGYGNVDAARILIEHGANVNVCNVNGSSPLKTAAQNNNIQTVQLLLDHNADVNLSNKQGLSPLLIASANNNVEIVKLLQQHKARVNDKNCKKQLFRIKPSPHAGFN